MKLLHTSDWHLGKDLYKHKRYDEYQQFLKWLLEIIEQEKIDTLLIAGDIFDTTTPSNKAQELYYRFLADASIRYCRNIIVIGGNHDSPSFLNAPKEVLKALNVFVIADANDNIEDEIIVLKDENEKPEAIVCAVPYLRERDIRRAESSENSFDKERAIAEGIKEHYNAVCATANEIRKNSSDSSIPLIATGHLFATGGKTSEKDGVRDLYVGSLGYVNASIFPEFVDYAALGHLHIPQIVGGVETIRYSGSPLQMSFGEKSGNKSVVVVDFSAEETDVSLVSVPTFQRLEQINGDFETINSKIEKLKKENENIWIEINYTGKEHIFNLKEKLYELTEDSNLEILRIVNKIFISQIMKSGKESETLEELTENEVFQRCLETKNVPKELRHTLINLFNTVVYEIKNQDANAE